MKRSHASAHVITGIAVVAACAVVVAVAVTRWPGTSPAPKAAAGGSPAASAAAAGNLTTAGSASPAPAASRGAAGAWSVAAPTRLPPTHAPYTSATDATVGTSSGGADAGAGSVTAGVSAAGATSPASLAPPAASQAPPKPAIISQLIPFGARRRAETVTYNRRHYGQATWRLTPKAIVLHYTAGGTEAGTHATFAADTPNMGVLPGVVAHFVIDRNGRIYQQLSLGIRGRHAVGMNHVAIGIEFVQDAGSGSTWATNQIFARGPQITAGLRLVRWLQWRYNIATSNVIGHAMANHSPLFKDLLGWRNTHTDWNAAAVRRFHSLLATG